MLDFESIPDKTGVYIFKNNEEKIIYIGKANSLKQRVKQYFFGNQDTRPQVDFIRKETTTLEYRLTETEQDALILEYNLISKHKPKYNVKLKDSNKYPYIMLSAEKYPYLWHTYSINKEGVFFGPYTSGLYVKTLVEKLNKIFSLRVCKTKLPAKKCIEFQMSNCAGVCASEEERQRYPEKISKVKSILNGGTKNLLTALNDEMRICAEREDFESAALIRDTIGFVGKEMRRGKKTGLRGLNADVFAMSREKSAGAFSVLKLRNGTIHEIITRRFSAGAVLEDDSVIIEIIGNYYQTTTDFDFKTLFVISQKTDDIKNLIFSNYDLNVKQAVKNTYAYQLYEIALENARNELCISLNRKFVSKGIAQLTADLHLKKMPEYIIGLDISHVNGEWTSGAVVSFKDGKPLKSAYRYYNLESIGNNDYLALSTILKRYLEKHPADMILIDGGLGQLSACRRVLDESGRECDLFALAKRFDILYDFQGKEIMLNGRSPAGALIKGIRDESHRFANKLRKIKMEKVNKKWKKKEKRV
ncbi:MAG: excinuclease ABC subunit UvrC [bacterium]|nr:excinuclease ABC subunit UvrC [bacterium]